MLRTTLSIVAISFWSMFSYGSNANADLVFTFTEGGGVVNVDLSGSLNLDATQGFLFEATNQTSSIRPNIGIVAVGGLANSSLYGIDAAGFVPYGTGGNFGGTGVGDRVALFFFGDPAVGVPLGYTSGDPLSGSATFTGDFGTLGIDTGTFVTTFSNGGFSDNIIVNVVPEPSASLLFGAVALTGVWRRRRKS